MSSAATAGGLLHQRVEESARRFADKIAVLDRRRTYRYRELVARAATLARILGSHGVGPGKFVAVSCAPGPDMIVAQLAVLMAGGAYLPLDPRYPRRRLSFMIEDSGAEILIADSAASDLAAQRVLRIEQVFEGRADELLKDSRLSSSVQVTASDLAYLIYTSGSTGQPKGVMIEHGSILNYVLWDIDAFGLSPRDRVSQVIAPSFDMSVWEIWPTLVSGASLHFADRADHGRPGALFRWMAEEAITHAVLPTPLAETLLGEPLPPALSLEKMLVAGDRLRVYPPKDLPFELYNVYGPTEATINATYARVTSDPDDGQRPPHIGKPIANVQVHILDESQRPVPAGAIGELYIGGGGVARGYHNRPELTEARFILDPFALTEGGRLYRTGDLARRRPDGNIDFIGRIDHQVKIRGHRIELGEIEATIAAHPRLKTALAVVVPSAVGERIVAYVVPVHADDPPPVGEILKHAEERLPPYMIPGQVIVLRELPLTPNGKIDREKLPMAESTGAQAGAPGSSLERTMADLWARVLGLEAVSVTDNFFALGGHSIAALSVLAEVERELSACASLRDIIEAPTVQAFCQRIRASLFRAEAPAAGSLPRGEGRPLELHDPFPLTDIQHAYWVGRNEVFALGGVGTHLYFELDGSLDLGRLEQAWRRVVAHHPMLRAVILEDGRQQILESVPPYSIAAADLRDATPEQIEAHLERVRAELSHQVLPTDRFPLFDIRATLLRGGALKLHLSFDALILDAQSLFRIVEEWHRLYEDPGRRLLPTATSFRDYIMALSALKHTEAYAVAAAYWKARVPSLPPGPELPLAVDPQAARRPRFRRRHFELSQEAWRSLQRRAHRAEVTETVALLTAYACALAAWSKSLHFCVNLTLFNRLPLCEDVQHIVGDFTSITLLEVDQREPGSFVERAMALQKQLWQDLDHRLYSGVEVLRDCMSHRGRITMPVVFTSELGFEALGRDAAALERLGSEAMAITQTPQVWIDLQVVDRGGRLVCYWDAVEELFSPGVLDAMFNAFREGVERLASADDAWTRRGRAPFDPVCLVATTVDERGADTLLQDGFLAWAAKAPERMAVLSSERELRYGELLAHARSVAASIALASDAEGSLVGVVLPRGWPQIVAVLGTLLAGGAYVPIDASLPTERRLAIMKQAGIRTALTLHRLARQLAWPAGVAIVAIDEREGPRASDDQREPRRARGAATSPAYVIFTSGSTGEPKGVVIEHRSAVNTIADINERFGVSASDRVFGVSSLSFDLSVYDIFGPLSRGGAVVLPEEDKSQDPAHWRQTLSEHGVTIWNSVPSLVTLLTDTEDSAPVARALGSLRLLLMSGDWIPVHLPDKLRRLRPDMELVSLGGATEASIWSIIHVIRGVDPAWRSIPYGRALKNQSFHVLDTALRLRPTWVVGELYIGGVGVARGYLHDPARTQASFIVHPETGERLYRTGDLGRYLPNGEIEFLGREDHQVKINGYRVELGEIEATLQRHPGIAACAVAALPGAQGRRLAGFVVLSDPTLSCADLRAYLARHVPAYMVPASFRVLPALPLTHNGKVDRSTLARLGEAEGGSVEAARPACEVERTVQQVWAELLGRQPELIDVTRNFFDLGGDSVSAIHLRARLEQRFDVVIPVTKVFEHSTVRALTDFINVAKEQRGGAGVLGESAAAARAGRRREAALRLRRRGN